MADDSASPYDRAFFAAQCFDSLQSARVALPLLFDHVRPRSVLDVGCGVGAWLRAVGDLGVADRLGVDGAYVDRGALMVPEDQFLPVELGQPGLVDAVSAHRATPGRFDLVMCLEVAEHLPFERSASLVDELCRLGDLVLFSAAIPFQYGTGHINEQWPEFWAIHFRARGYACFDLLRPALWGQAGVDWWYAQNLLVFAREGSAAYASLPVAAAADGRALALVHPEAWLSSILNLWRPYRAAARQEEPQDFRALRDGWIGGADLPPALRAVERARNAPATARDVFPFTRTEVDEPERRLATAREEAAALRGQLEDARTGPAALQHMADTQREMLEVQAAATQAAREEAAALRGQLEDARTGLAALQHMADTQREMMELQAAATQAAQEQLAALLGSTSWRITAPLRGVRRLFG